MPLSVSSSKRFNNGTRSDLSESDLTGTCLQSALEQEKTLRLSRMAYYILRPWGGRKFGTRYAYADILDPQITGDPRSYGVCPVCGSGLGPCPWLPPHRIRLSKAVYPDFLWGAGFELMVSERFLSLYREAGLTGITHIDPPAEVVKIGRKRAEEVFPPPPAYHNVWYVHGGADLDDERSRAKRPPNLCGYCRQGVEQVLRVDCSETFHRCSRLFIGLR